ncbi:putative CoA-substrate-specific enzyme activase [Desulfosalsimonas propionicica]|uniref:Putative CoA-substrate-specific enzyme activase n=1 Tax=Desulfosalsimonas propionicica TaxID=332175 RepID=A0A7W0C6R1_9BACT|nr:acyl-CoA dehydratase activase [Desulfosalsimonas propionicica]MBA2880215.1 putative CoA-substrate-specific enzyme activase [Desulfosalsimonas propionicica]
MITAGCDIGSLSAKAVIMDDNTIAGWAVIPAGISPADSAAQVLTMALETAGRRRQDIAAIVATGYGKEMIAFADHRESEILCHAKGAVWSRPETRTVIDIGGQDAKAIRIDDTGAVTRYLYNDKCASGTGRFLEVMAEALGVALEDMGTLSEQAAEKVVISNQCVIFAETEVVSLINDGREVPDIIRGLHNAMAGRVAAMALSIGVEDAIVMTGGVAKNPGLFAALAAALKKPLIALDGIDPQINGALGAALIAGQKR